MIFRRHGAGKLVRVLLLICVLVMMPAAAACNNAGQSPDDLTENTETPAPTFPVEKPDLPIPADFTLSEFASTFTGEKVVISDNTINCLFTDCEVQVSTDNIEISECCFGNTQVILSDAGNVTFDRVIFRDLYQYKQVALGVYDCRDIKVDGC